jgi:hypothetical protein
VRVRRSRGAIAKSGISSTKTWPTKPFETLQWLQRNLHLSVVPLKPTTFKQHDQPLRTLIGNYDQFAEDLRLSGSPLADFLE